MSNITNYSFLFQSMFGGTKSTWGAGATLPGMFQFSQLNSSSIQSQLKAAGIDTSSKQYKAVIQQMTNVDHQFQKAGFDKKRLFYTQGDYGLWQCSRPCHQKTYDNEETVRRMLSEQKDMRIPPELIPECPVCGAPMTMNLRQDDSFVQDEGWYAAAERYNDFLRRHKGVQTLFLELGVGGNTPGIIKYPFWQMTAENPKAKYACINYGEAYVPDEIVKRSICINADIGEVLKQL